MGGLLAVVVGGQYGSEGKGAVAAQLSKNGPGRHCAVRVAGPNAGHTVIGPIDLPGSRAGTFNGVREWKLRAVPVAAVSRPDADLVIAAGSEIDQQVLAAEVDELDAAGYNVSHRLLIDSQATILSPTHIAQEVGSGLTARLGSTAKGIGAARADRAWRGADLASRFYDTVDTTAHLRGVLAAEGSVVIEGTQGFGLGLHAGEYPYCTSSDCRALDFLAMTGLSPWEPAVSGFTVYVVARTRPIRVAGNSGRLKDETTWTDLGLPEEHTTVTNKVRRVGEWDGDLVRRALVANGGPGYFVRLVVTMVDQVFPEAREVRTVSDLHSIDGFSEWADRIEEEVGSEIYAVGVAPDRQIPIGIGAMMADAMQRDGV